LNIQRERGHQNSRDPFTVSALYTAGICCHSAICMGMAKRKQNTTVENKGTGKSENEERD
jgi:hypothetical protein